MYIQGLSITIFRFHNYWQSSDFIPEKKILEILQRLSRRFSFPHIKDISMQEIVRHKNWTKIHKTTENVE